MKNNKINRILSITKILIKNEEKNPYIIDPNTNKINKKSLFVWLSILIAFVIIYVSYYTLAELVKIGQSVLFFNIYFLIMMAITAMQSIILTVNIFYFSNEIENILPYPIKKHELLIAKFISLLSKIYTTIVIFLLSPLIIYGIVSHVGITYYIFAIISFILFPLIISFICVFIMMIVMKIAKFVKNKEIFQILITFMMLIIMFVGEFLVIKYITGNSVNEESMIEITKITEQSTTLVDKFIIITPFVKILLNEKIFLNIIKIILILIIQILIFFIVGSNLYWKELLKNNTYIKSKNRKLKIKNKKKSKTISYLAKEFKEAVKNPIVFMQCFYPLITICVAIVILIIASISNIQEIMKNENLNLMLGEFKFNIGVMLTIIGIIQLITTLSNLSITAISREGKNAIFMKYIPIDYSNQIVYKSIPQIIVNSTLSIIIVVITSIFIRDFELIYCIMTIIISILINIICSILMVLVDLKRPNLNWDTEIDIFKQNPNKVYQYSLSVIIILLLIYFKRILGEITIMKSSLIIISVLILIIILIYLYIRKKQNKLFNKVF